MQSQLSWILALLLTVILGFVAAFAPTLPTLVAEARFSNAVENLGKSADFRGITDGALRTRMQGLARERGLHIEFEEMFIQYLGKRHNETMPQPSRLGYSLPLELRLFGFLPWRIVAVRLHVVQGEKES